MRVVVAEKPSVARELASFLGASTRREGYFEGDGVRVTWALGHLATLKEPQDYDPSLKRWSLEPLPIVPERFELKPIAEKGAGQQFAVVARLLRSADEVVCATDAGREGELIFRYIAELAGCVDKPARRLWLSSLTREAIRDAFARLRPLADYDLLYAAARCRSEADWLVGLNATRSYTVRHRSSGVLWSVGRVQTPVLALIVGRDDEIRTFRPEPFWELTTRYRQATFRYAGGRLPAEADGLDLLARVEDHPFAIRQVERKPERVLPPQLYDLTELQRDMNRRYGLSADATLKAAQALYEAKLISYPRTDSRHLGSDLKPKVPKILADLRPLKPAEIGGLDLGALAFSRRVVDDARVGDHHAIIPTGKRPGPSAGSAADKVFDAVVIRLIAAFYPACLKEVTAVEGESNAVPFKARGVRIVEPGWTALYPRRLDDSKEDEQELPGFAVGESGPHEPGVRRGETSPPKPYTEATLLGAMETAGKLVDDEGLKEALKERGLGTPATRAAIIETLLARGYIARDKKALATTDLGRYLIAVIGNRALKSPELTGDWEAKLRQVERGQLDPRQFMGEIVRYAGEVVRPPEVPVDPSRLGDCPICGRPVIEGRKGFGCSGWRDGCSFTLWREFEGLTLADDQVRELLQRRVLARPIGVEGRGEVLLKLADTGGLVAIPVPAEAPRRPAAKAGRRPAAARDGAKSRKRGRSPQGSDPTPAEEPADGFAAVALGPCPLCKAEVVDGAKSYGCSGWRQGCKFAIWKTIAGRKIAPTTARALLKSGRSPVLRGFSSKSGERFQARLKLDGGEVRFDFTA